MEDKRILNDIVKWWEKKRLWFNIIVCSTGIICILVMNLGFFLIFDFIGIVIFGIVANVFYSTGILVELLDIYYLRGKLKLYDYRLLFFIIGTLATCYFTIIIAIEHYNLILLD